jgi:TetR/AcrR family transcriptional regulator, cholesterol catabolism regulator
VARASSKLVEGAAAPEAPKRGRPRRGPDPDRFQEIVAAAAETILEKGYSATSIQDIADAVGILKGSLYHYVRSKEDFLYAIIKDVYDAALVEIAPIIESKDGALERLRAFVDTHVHFGVRHLTAFTIQVREFSRLSQERQDEITKGGDAYLNALRTILRDGQKEGVVDKKLDVRLTSFVILGELNFLTRWYNPQGRMSPERISAIYSGLILSSVVSDTAVDAVGGIENLRRGVMP